ncbi:MAG: TerB family tellurite resistance protein [Lutibacter sp.]|uniref:TerB family tellurite resistance protein n=1 Tax=Lutibacter sp. TaxID=1925666 RepID=UPI0019E70DC9|nr:TerB family tellurite resistance protein [Lutibacter sp.]NOR29205.1 TerB family tellurite resistance protein [Lutibacter sp.]
MGLSDYNLSGEQKRNIAHFASIVRLALADNVITEGEEKLLKRVAKRFHILEDKYNEIIDNANSYSLSTPHDYNERIEYLYDLTKMVYADGNASEEEASVLRKICVGLGFPLDNIEKVSNEAIHLILNNNDLEDFNKAIKQVNKI